MTGSKYGLVYRIEFHFYLQKSECLIIYQVTDTLTPPLRTIFGETVMADQQRKIYQSDGDRYEALISREDYHGNIPRAIDEILRVDGLDVIDLGAGTGRLTLLLAPRAKSIRAFDLSAEMLRVCRERLIKSGLSNWYVEVADHRQLPVQDHSVNLVVSGWSVSYLAVWNPQNGQAELDKWLAEMKRILRRNGIIILFESLGTGNESPI